MPLLARMGFRALSYCVAFAIVSVLFAGTSAAYDDYDDEPGPGDMVIRLEGGFIIVPRNSKIFAGGFGQDASASDDATQSGGGINATAWIAEGFGVGVFGGGFGGDGVSAEFDLDRFIIGADTWVTNQWNGYGGAYATVRQPLAEAWALEFKGGGGFIGSETDIKTIAGGGQEIRWSDDETKGFGFAEASLRFTRHRLTVTAGGGIIAVEDSNFRVPTQFGDANFTIDNGLDAYATVGVGIQFGPRERIESRRNF